MYVLRFSSISRRYSLVAANSRSPMSMKAVFRRTIVMQSNYLTSCGDGLWHSPNQKTRCPVDQFSIFWSRTSELSTTMILARLPCLSAVYYDISEGSISPLHLDSNRTAFTLVLCEATDRAFMSCLGGKGSSTANKAVDDYIVFRRVSIVPL
ncbi:hypothetical protein SISSUDRAFT_312089 [Sistotremastrum suecicum HHB10207 ss-3]|uniref:Uncharacterized protein n=1 Tax=Sistotremastrum suecicum HHB10207 ss-3 TaxID=1314776 RepID=A0A165ZCM6_9AGAM|nr:hypothetical protein SISSUDRAFT_312089 [Sistotremastrum suecicum HHB10207 ss-3]